MLQHEDSILSSPSSSKKSVRKLRNIRKCKRRVRSKGSEKEMYLQRLYEDSDSDGEILNQTFVITSRVRDYVSFEMENILVKADRYAPTDNVPNLPKQEEGFRTCESLTEQKTKDNDDQLFLITDSELLNCCHEADKAIMKTPSKELRLVNSILDDFCLSPLSTVEPTIRFWEYSPQFIFKNKPEKTYSRQNRRLNFKESCSDDEDALSSSSSSLFCTQVYSQLEDDLYNTTVVANVSQRLDKNLLDLTSTFTQETSPPMSDSSTRNSSPLSTFPSIRNLENLTREICELKRRYPNRQLRLESSSSGEEGFRGFAISNVVGSGATEISLSEDDCDVGGLDETLLSPQKFHISDEDHEIVLCSDSDKEENYHARESKKCDYNNYWNDDCPEVFALIKTQEILHQQRSSLQNDNNLLIEDNCLNNMNISFKTASSKSIVISKEAQGRALEIIKDLPKIKPKKIQESLTKDIPSKEDFEISLEYQINLATKNMCNQNKNIYDMPSTSKAASIANKRRSIEDIGFKTAAGKMVNISSQAMKNAEKLLSEFCSDDVNDLESMKTEIFQKRSRKSNCEPQQDYNENNGKYWDNESDLANVVFSEWPLEDKLQEHSKTSMHLCKDNEFPKSANCQTNLDGFHTAGGKALTISAKSKNAVAKLLRDFQSDSDINTCEEDLYEIKQTILAKHNKLKARNQSNAGGNETKEGKSVQLLPTENDGANLIQNYKTNCDNFENNTFRNAIKCVDNDNNLNVATPTLYNNQQDFQTARGRKILVSAKAEKAVANMLQNLDCCENKAFEEEIMELKNKLQSKHKEQKVTNYSLNEKKNNVVAADHNSLSNISMPKIPSPPAVTLKRTIDTKSVYTPPSKKSFIDAKSSFSDLSSRSPLNSSATKSIISRKNLLSLSKKRKQKINLSTCNNNENTRQKFELEEESSTSLLDRSETPIKIKASSSLQAPMTPNLNEFFNNATKSSTPRTGVCSKSLHEIDDGFKPIAWNASNTLTTIKPTKLSDDSCSNITLNSTNPTASDRIGRLTMYGEPPAISPIPMETRNCRHPGLRRTRRSMANKSENH